MTTGITDRILLIPFDSLSVSEQSELTACESVIERNLSAFHEMGRALQKIRDGRLYRHEYETFEDYCQGKWGLGRNYANKVIQASEVVENLSNGYHGTQTQIPTSERQARELASLEPEKQIEVWQVAVETAPNGKVTAEHIRETRQAILGETEAVEEPEEDDEPEEAPKPKAHVAHNSGNNEWYTPAEYIEAARVVLEVIDLDPASSRIANKIVKAKNYFTAKDDGLKRNWSGRVWMNPPYSSDLIGQFTEQLARCYLNYDISEAIVLVNNATDTAWFQQLANAASAICFPKGRIKYLDASGQPVNAPLQGQAFLYLGRNSKKFESVFSRFGFVVSKDEFTEEKAARRNSRK